MANGSGFSFFQEERRPSLKEPGSRSGGMAGSVTCALVCDFSIAVVKHHNQGKWKRGVYLGLQFQTDKNLSGQEIGAAGS